MKAVYCTKYGSVDNLQFKEIEKPTLKENRLLIKMHAASVNALDLHLIIADIPLVRLMGGLFKPSDPKVGVDLAGVVEAVGSNVTKFKAGDEVFGRGSGSFAEYATAGETAVALKPASLSFAEAAATPIAAITALQALRDRAKVQPGQKVLIQGAGGGVGTFAVQLAKLFGAEVTAVCGANSIEIAHALGADHIVDYAAEDITASSVQFDSIIAINGYHSIHAYRHILSPAGVYVGVGGSKIMRSMLEMMMAGAPFAGNKKQKIANMMTTPTPADLLYLKDLLEAQKIKPIIDRIYPFSETIQAIKHMQNGHVHGKIVISMEQ